MRPRASRFCRLPASGLPLPGRDLRPWERPSGRESASIAPSLFAGAWLKRAPSPIPFRGADGQVRPFHWRLPHGSPDLSALWARRMAVRRHAAGSARTAGGRVALCVLQLAAFDRAGRCAPGAVRDLPRNEPGAPVRRLLYVLELRRGFARCVSRRDANLPASERAGGRTGAGGSPDVAPRRRDPGRDGAGAARFRTGARPESLSTLTGRPLATESRPCMPRSSSTSFGAGSDDFSITDSRAGSCDRPVPRSALLPTPRTLPSRIARKVSGSTGPERPSAAAPLSTQRLASRCAGPSSAQ